MVLGVWMMCETKKRRSLFGTIALSVTGAAALGLSIVAIPFVTPAIRKHCLPFVPATNSQIQNVIHLIKKHNLSRTGNHLHKLHINGLSMIDLGSGDGRIVLSAASEVKELSTCAGVELNLWLVLYSRFKAWDCGLGSRCRFYKANLWDINLNQYDYIVVFGVAEMMGQLKEKLSNEMKTTSYILACRFPIDTRCQHICSAGDGIDTVWMYNKNSLARITEKTDQSANYNQTK